MRVERNTSETQIMVELDPGTGKAVTRTDIPFLNHMMTVLAKYSGLDLILEASGDLRHHIVEDIAITAGTAFAEILPAACARYGDRTVAMDDAVVQVIVDAGGRPFYEGPLPSALYDHWMRSFADNARMTIHVIVIRGSDRHHIVEAAFKALGFALRDVLKQTDAVFSTKGKVSVRKS